MLRLITGAAAGERVTVAPNSVSSQSVSCVSAADLAGYPLRQALSASPTSSGTTGVVRFSLPSSFAAEVGLQGGNVNVQTQILALAPSPDGTVLVSPLAGLSVGPAGGTGTSRVANLSLPVLITIPVNGAQAGGTPLGCVYWDGEKGGYSSAGCTVTSITATSVTCACTHLTVFAVAQLGPAMAGTTSDRSKFNPVTSTLGNSSVQGTDRSSSGSGDSTSSSGPAAMSWTISSSIELSGSIPLASFQELTQKAVSVRSMVTASISDALLRASSSGVMSNVTVVVVKICFSGQCISFQADGGIRRVGGQQVLSVSFNVTGTVLAGVDSKSSIALAQTATLSKITSDTFGKQLATAIETHAVASGLGSWSVNVKVTLAGSADSAGNNNATQRPDFKATGSSPSANGASPDNNGLVSTSGGTTVLSIAALVGASGGAVGILLICAAVYGLRVLLRRKSMKVQDLGGWVAADETLSPGPDPALNQTGPTGWYDFGEDESRVKMEENEEEEIQIGRDAGATSSFNGTASEIKVGERPTRVNRARQRLESLKALMDQFEDETAQQRGSCGLTSEPAAVPTAAPAGERVRIVFRRPTTPLWQSQARESSGPSPPTTPRNPSEGNGVGTTASRRESLLSSQGSSFKRETLSRPKTPPEGGTATPKLILGSLLRQQEATFSGPSTPKEPVPSTPRWHPTPLTEPLPAPPPPPQWEPPAYRPAFYQNLRQPAAVSPPSGDGLPASGMFTPGSASRRSGIPVSGLLLPPPPESLPGNAAMGPSTPRYRL
jgi:hypothetical protein